MDPKTSRHDLPRLALGRIGRKALEDAIAHGSSETESWWKKVWPSSRRIDNTARKILFLVCGPEPYVCDAWKASPVLLTSDLE